MIHYIGRGQSQDRQVLLVQKLIVRQPLLLAGHRLLVLEYRIVLNVNQTKADHRLAEHGKNL